ncbi:MAG: helix-turn-helix transcriptional regulator [Smithella sp.]
MWLYAIIIGRELLGLGMVPIFAYKFKYKLIGRKVAYYRRLKGLTQEKLAERIHISKSTLCKIECGRYNNNLSLSMLMAIAEELHIDVIMLLNFDKLEQKLEQESHNINTS